MNKDEVETVKEALDTLMFSLSQARKYLTTKEQQLYEKAIRILEEHGG